MVDRPDIPSLVLAGVITLVGWAYHAWIARATGPPVVAVDEGAPDTKPAPLPGHRLEPPAVVAVLTNGFRVPASAITATALDLAARGWIRLWIISY